ncbi:AraC family transcriptional regulator [Mycetocola reblochoni]|nr:AraC family transcriptional regulator [Mycetocola reblochoni]
MSERVEQDTVWQEHSHPTHELIWHENGASSATVGRRRWTITRSMGLWIPAGTPHSGRMPAGSTYRAHQFSVSATPALAAEAVGIELTPLLRLLLERLGENGLADASRALTEEMVLDVMRPSPRRLLLELPQSPLLRPIADRCQDSPSDTTTLAEWSSLLGVSSRTITRSFLAETGVGFSQWVATAKAQHAIAALTRGESLDDVAEQVGYASASAFSTAFRRVTGTSPGRFRTGG